MCIQRTRKVIAGGSDKASLMCNSQPLGLRWNGMFLYRVILSPGNYGLLLHSSPKVLQWLKDYWPPEPSRALGIADSQGNVTHDSHSSFA